MQEVLQHIFQGLQKCGLPEHLLPANVRDSSDDSGGGVYYFHHENREALEASADQGCHSCAMIWGRLFASRDCFSKPAHTFAREQVYLRRTWLDEWIEKEGSDALFESEWVMAYCEARYMYSSLRLSYSGK